MPKITTAQSAGLGNVRAQAGPEAPVTYQRAPSTSDPFGGVAARSLGRAAEGLNNAAIQMDKIQEQKNALAVADIDRQVQSQIMEKMYGENGLLTQEGALAQDTSSEYKSFMEGIKRQYMSSTAASPRVRELAGRRIDELALQNLDVAMRHEATQRKAFGREIATSQNALAMENVALNYNDDEAFARSWENIQRATVAQAKIDGLSQDGLQLALKQNRSTLITGRVSAMLLSDNPEYIIKAQKIFQDADAKGQVWPEDAQRLDKLLDAVVPNAKAKQALFQFQNEGQLEGVASDELSNRIFDVGMISTESRGNQFDENGAPLESSAGAIGIAQVMEGTGPEAARAAGLEWDRDRWLHDKEYNFAIGKAYFGTLQNRYQSNTLAVLAYNWGMGRVDKHIENYGDPRKGEISYTAFLKHVPSREAREYVPKVIEAADLGMDVAGLSEFAQGLEPEVQVEFNKMVEAQMKAEENSKKLIKTELLDEAMPIMYQSNGDWTQIPAQLRADLMQNGAWEEVVKYNGQSHPDVLADFYSMSPEELAAVDFDSYMEVENADGTVTSVPARLLLSESDYKTWLGKQSEVSSSASAKSVELNRSQIAATTFQSVTGFDPTNKKTDFARYNQLLQTEIDGFKDRNSRPPTAEEIQGMADMLLTPISSGGWFGKTKKFMHSYSIEDVPDETRIEIEEYLRSKGDVPTNSKVIQLYTMRLADAGE